MFGGKLRLHEVAGDFTRLSFGRAACVSLNPPAGPTDSDLAGLQLRIPRDMGRIRRHKLQNDVRRCNRQDAVRRNEQPRNAQLKVDGAEPVLPAGELSGTQAQRYSCARADN